MSSTRAIPICVLSRAAALPAMWQGRLRTTRSSAGSFIRFLWGDTLNSVEQEQLRNADQQELNRLMFDYRRRARFQVLETFSHAESREFEVFTNLDGPSCGFAFVEGETYLVEAYRNNLDQRWKVASCSPLRLGSASPEEANALRAWKAGLQP